PQMLLKSCLKVLDFRNVAAIDVPLATTDHYLPFDANFIFFIACNLRFKGNGGIVGAVELRYPDSLRFVEEFQKRSPRGTAAEKIKQGVERGIDFLDHQPVGVDHPGK